MAQALNQTARPGVGSGCNRGAVPVAMRNRRSVVLRAALLAAIAPFIFGDAILAAEPYRVLSASGGTSSPAVLLVPGCSGFVASNGVNPYDERAGALQAAGYVVVFVDYLGRRSLRNCAGGRDVSHAEVGKDILEAAAWIRDQPGIAAARIAVIVWSYGGGGVIAALAAMPPGPPLLAKAVMYYPDCRRAIPWSSTGVSVLLLMGAIDEVALPALCDAVTKAAPANSLRAILYSNARHAFDVRSLPERAEFGRLGYNAAAAQASWETVLEFLR